MAVEDPGSYGSAFDGTFTVVCDDCGEEADVPATEYAGDPSSWGVEDSSLLEIGWTRCGNTVYCPDCSDKEEVE